MLAVGGRRRGRGREEKRAAGKDAGAGKAWYRVGMAAAWQACDAMGMMLRLKLGPSKGVCSRRGGQRHARHARPHPHEPKRRARWWVGGDAIPRL